MKKKKKLILDFEDEIDFELIGICSHHVDYRIAWDLNNTLEFHLERIENYPIYNKTGTITSSHSMYFYFDEENKTSFYLIKNKHAGNYLIPEKTSIDYFLIIYDNFILDLKEFIKKIKKTASVLGVYPFDPNDIASAKNIELI